MSHLETLSTVDVAARLRVDYWNELACSNLTPLVTSPVRRADFYGRLSRANLGDIRIAEVSSEPASVYHSTAHVACEKGDAYLVLMQLRGSTIQRQDGRDVCIKEGDFSLFDCTRPFEIHFTEPVSTLVVRVSGYCLRRYLANPDKVTATAMSRASGINSVASRFLRDVWSSSEVLGDCGSGARIGRILLDLIGAAYTNLPQSLATPLSASAYRRVQIFNFIEAHLTDPTLSPTLIADRFRITARYLHRVFSRESETLSLYIRRRRLELSALALTDTSQHSRSISYIALQHGFSSVAHFCKAFRDQYGVPPGDYRRAGVNSEAGCRLTDGRIRSASLA